MALPEGLAGKMKTFQVRSTKVWLLFCYNLFYFSRLSMICQFSWKVVPPIKFYLALRQLCVVWAWWASYTWSTQWVFLKRRH